MSTRTTPETVATRSQIYMLRTVELQDQTHVLASTDGEERIRVCSVTERVMHQHYLDGSPSQWVYQVTAAGPVQTRAGGDHATRSNQRVWLESELHEAPEHVRDVIAGRRYLVAVLMDEVSRA